MQVKSVLRNTSRQPKFFSSFLFLRQHRHKKTKNASWPFEVCRPYSICIPRQTCFALDKRVFIVSALYYLQTIYFISYEDFSKLHPTNTNCWLWQWRRAFFSKYVPLGAITLNSRLADCSTKNNSMLESLLDVLTKTIELKKKSIFFKFHIIILTIWTN